MKAAGAVQGWRTIIKPCTKNKKIINEKWRRKQEDKACKRGRGEENWTVVKEIDQHWPVVR